MSAEDALATARAALETVAVELVLLRAIAGAASTYLASGPPEEAATPAWDQLAAALSALDLTEEEGG